MIGSAEFSEDRAYRYVLTREWLLGSGTCAFIMLNPSTADERVLDPTVRRCVRYAQSWMFKRLVVLNLFAWRSTDPKELYQLADPVGPGNMKAIVEQAVSASRVVCAWGVHGRLHGQDRIVITELLKHGVSLWSLGVNADGTPKHPLYLKRSAEIQRYP